VNVQPFWVSSDLSHQAKPVQVELDPRTISVSGIFIESENKEKSEIFSNLDHTCAFLKTILKIYDNHLLSFNILNR
jgi:hypothetical protein